MLPAAHFLVESPDFDDGEGVCEQRTHLVPPALGF
jgi:hypothetical protein